MVVCYCLGGLWWCATALGGLWWCATALGFFAFDVVI